MDKKRNLGIVGGVLALVVAVTGVSMVWAAFSQDLQVNSNMYIFGNSWEIKFNNLQAAVTGNDGGVTSTARQVTAPSIVGDTVIENYSVELKTPGDYVSYEFDIENNGDYDAIIDSGFAMPTPTCTGTGDNAATDAAKVCSHLSYTLTYKEDSSAVSAGDTLMYGDFDINNGVKTRLNADDSVKTVVLKLYYDKNTPAEDLPTNDVTISNLGITIPYVQK